MDIMQALSYLRQEHQRIVQVRWMALGRLRGGCALTAEETLALAIVEASASDDYETLVTLAEQWKRG